MKIRAATHDDIPAIVDMAFRFYPASNYDRIAPLQKEAAAGLAIVTMDTDVMLVAEDDAGKLQGMVCLRIEPFLFNTGVVIAQEIVWWVEPEARGGMTAVRMRKAAEDAARAKGATRIRMAVLPSSPPAAAEMLVRADYRESETYFVRDL